MTPSRTDKLPSLTRARAPVPCGATDYGPDGLFTLALSTATIAGTLGLSLLWQTVRVARLAREAPAESAGELALVLGSRLHRDTVKPEFAQRLLRAKTLYDQGCCRSVMIVGGCTGRARVSEAKQGREFLIGLGMPEQAIAMEECSRHTLENLAHARTLLAMGGEIPLLVLISSRYHLARSSALAQGLGLPHVVCGAEQRLTLAPALALRLLLEGFYLHWYAVGRAWSLLTRNHRSLRRIT